MHGYWSVTTSKHINHVADTYNLVIVKDAPKAEAENQETSGGGMLKAVAMVAAFGDVLYSNQAEKNDWKLRMMKAGLSNRGLTFPADWDTLSEEEKTKRLDAALGAIA